MSDNKLKLNIKQANNSQSNNSQSNGNQPYQPNYNQQNYNPQYQQNYNQLNYNQPNYEQNYNQQQTDYVSNSGPTSSNDNNHGKVLGILSIIFGFISPIIGLILGIIGLIKSKKNVESIGFYSGKTYKNTPKILNIIGIIISIIITSIIILIFIFGAVGFRGFGKYSSKGYGQPTSDAVIKQYWSAMADGDENKAELCFPYGSTVDLDFTEASKWSWELDVENDLKTTLTSEEMKDWNTRFNMEFESVEIYDSFCHFVIPGDPEYRSLYNLSFTIGKYNGIFYILNVEDLGEYNDSVSENTDLGNEDLGYITVSTTWEPVKKDEIEDIYPNYLAYQKKYYVDETPIYAQFYMINTDQSSKSLAETGKETWVNVLGMSESDYNVIDADNLMGFKNAIYTGSTFDTDGIIENIDMYTFRGADGDVRHIIFIYFATDTESSVLWQSYRLTGGLQAIDTQTQVIIDGYTEEPTTTVEDTSEDITEDTTEATTETTTETKSDITTDLYSEQFIMDGVTYTLPFDYALIKDKYTFDLSDYGKEDGYILNPEDKTSSTIELQNSELDKDFDFYVGFVNTTDTAIDIKESSIWAVDFDKSWSKTDNYPNIVLPGGITWGSSIDDIKKAYGEPSEEPYYADSMKYWEYTYLDNDYRVYLTIYEDSGLSKIRLQSYIND